MKQSAALLPLLLVGSLAALSFWLQSITEPGGKDLSGRGRHDPDFIIDTFTLQRFNPEGTLQHTIHAQRMMHYPDDDSTMVLSPNVVFHGTPPSRLSSREASISKDAKTVQMRGDVLLQRKPTDAVETQVATSKLDILPDDELASTDQPVTITQGLTVINGTGLTANNKTQITTLYGPVRGTIYRNQGKTP